MERALAPSATGGAGIAPNGNFQKLPAFQGTLHRFKEPKTDERTWIVSGVTFELCNAPHPSHGRATTEYGKSLGAKASANP